MSRRVYRMWRRRPISLLCSQQPLFLPTKGVWVWRRINDLFNYLPLAASIEGKILCMHGGIGRSIHKVEQISAIPRPVTMEDGGPVLMDLLWSDPTTNDAVTGVQPSPRGPGLVTFGPDRVKDFCKVGQHWGPHQGGGVNLLASMCTCLSSRLLSF